MSALPDRLVRLLRSTALCGLAAGALVVAPVAGGLDRLAQGMAVARGAPDSFADLAARLLPAVVNISSTETVKPGDNSDDDDDDPGDGGDQGDQGSGNQGGGNQGGDQGGQGGGGGVPAFPPGSPFEKFFHDFMNRHRGASPNGDNAPRKMQALGSGFIIDPSGLIVTNNHVIKGADEITVTLQDDTVLKAKLIGHDDNTDLALLQVKTDRKLPSVSFGDSDGARVGDWVVAIGNPFGLSGTVTAGIVSSRGRDIHQGEYDDFIQTDAPINRGNSGGPLFDMDGQVVGVNTAIYSPSGGSIGIGFAIPANEAKLVVAQLRQFGHARRGWIGVHIQDVTPDIAEGLGLKPAKGALIAGVEPGGPAAKAQLHPGDVITAVGGKPVDARALPRLVAETPVGQSVQLAIWRDGKSQTMSLAVAEFPEAKAPPPDKAQHAAPKPPPTAATTLAGTGLKLAAISSSLRQKYRIAADQKGVVVTDVASGSTAADRGLQPGDVIVQMQQTDIATPAQLQDVVAEARKQKRHVVLLLVQNNDGRRYVPLPLEGGRTP